MGSTGCGTNLSTKGTASAVPETAYALDGFIEAAEVRFSRHIE
jgi:hypothetical protein